jgi:hypothetical protein
MQDKAILLVVVLILMCKIGTSAEIRRTHSFARPIAMGDAFTAVADSKATIGYNPAGLLQKNSDWSLTLPLLGVTYNEIVKNWNNTETKRDFGDTETLKDLPGKRVFVELQIPLMASYFDPNLGFYMGIDGDAWLEITFPPQTIIPTVGIDLVAQAVYDFAKAFEVWGINLGVNAKFFYRRGIVADLDLLSIASYLENEDYNGLIDEYAADQPEPKLVFDFGLLYRFDHPWKPRIGISASDVLSVDLAGENEVTYGGINFGSAGEVRQLNSIGFAFTKDIDEFDLTGSIDFHDITYSYFPSESISRRIAIGFEAGYGRKTDNSHLVAIQLGLRELKYPSLGLGLTLGIIEFNTVSWIENFGTEQTEILDTRYMFLISFVF